jgi:hypothetical protein
LPTAAGKLFSELYKNINADWNTPDHKMISHLTQNVYSFSAAKNYQELHDIINATAL